MNHKITTFVEKGASDHSATKVGAHLAVCVFPLVCLQVCCQEFEFEKHLSGAVRKGSALI